MGSSLIFSGTKKDNNMLANKIDHKLLEIEKFLGNNNLKMNVSKTELLRSTTRQQITRNKAETFKLQSLDENGLQIVPNKKAKILGVVFSDNLTWANHLETGKSAIIPNCKRKLGALKHTSNRASFKDKKRLADGVIMSRLTYGIAIWGLNAAKTTINKVQIVQNLTMKWVTGIKIGISTKQLLDKLGWLSIYQLAIYHSVLLYWKVKNKQEPSRIVELLQLSQNSNHRIELTGRIWSKLASSPC